MPGLFDLAPLICAIGLGTLRHWERGDRTPRGTTLVLLNIIAKEPKTVLRPLLRLRW